MGTDIHGAIQRKTNAHGFITVLSLEFIERDYSLFNLISGARNYAASLIEPRGLPTDGWDWEELERRSDGDHSKTWLTLVELKEVRKALYKLPDYSGLNLDLEAWIAAMEAYDGETRIVFWFDN